MKQQKRLGVLKNPLMRITFIWGAGMMLFICFHSLSCIEIIPSRLQTPFSENFVLLTLFAFSPFPILKNPLMRITFIWGAGMMLFICFHSLSCIEIIPSRLQTPFSENFVLLTLFAFSPFPILKNPLMRITFIWGAGIRTPIA